MNEVNPMYVPVPYGENERNLIGKVAILLTAHPRQQKWWTSVLLSLENYPGPLILAYDDLDVKMIPDNVTRRFSRIVCNDKIYGLARGELVCIRNGLRAANELDVSYVLKLGFDEPVWRWRNILRMLDELKKYDIDCIHNYTRLIFGRADLLLKAFELHDVTTIESKPAEAHFRGIIKELNIKNRGYCDYDYWRSLLGVTHLQGEYATNIGQQNSYSWKIGELWPRK